MPTQEKSRMIRTRVLVADDEPGMLELIKEMLDPHDFQVTTALNVRDALTALLKANAERAPFQIVITDIRMPGMSGLGMLYNLQLLEPGMPVIAMTGYSCDDLPAQLKQCGCRLCLNKPFDKQQLLDAIEKALVPQ